MMEVTLRHVLKWEVFIILFSVRGGGAQHSFIVFVVVCSLCHNEGEHAVRRD